MKIRALIAEDEQMAQEELLYLLEKQPDIVLCPCAENGQQLIALYEAYAPDVIFLDVHMPQFSGMEAAKRIIGQAKHEIPLFVLTTAYDEYALQAFEIEAVDYLLKPFDETRFDKALQRIRQKLSQRILQEVPHASPAVPSRTNKLLVDDGEKTVVLTPEMIYYAVPSPSQRALEIHTKDKVIVGKLTLQELEKKLQGFNFFRTHRSYLVNINYIQEITPWFNGTSNVTLSDISKTKIPVSRAARKELFQLLEMQG
ncbi:LytTR family DNA-binding domain-containing protein [Lentibacillus sp. L22]|uniref:LytR/AlgR family response regulator transcription factor n=1 Tax=Lentibacillus TaxID=175304 RepID=UPI0022B14FEE|nr:LytTR family DNA-binding domain-containing protein [Lentibacillus daqui]